MTNSLAANQIMLVDHKCKFAFYGCDVKMKLDEIVVHEKTCPERTIICPRSQCKEEVQLRKFTKHATKSNCSVPRDAQSKPILYELAPPGCEFNPNENQSFRIMSFQDHDRTFLDTTANLTGAPLLTLKKSPQAVKTHCRLKT